MVNKREISLSSVCRNSDSANLRPQSVSYTHLDVYKRQDPYKLEQYHLSLSQVIEAIENNNASVGGSILNRGDLGYVVRGIGLRCV